MKVYVISVESSITGEVKVSQEGYNNLEAAKAFVNSRTIECREWINEWVCMAKNYIYEIVEVNIQ